MGSLAGTGNVCALSASGSIGCAGFSMMITAETSRAYPWPVSVAGQTLKFKDVSGANWHTCATVRDGRVACWGASGNTALGTTAAVPNMPPAPGVFVKEGGGELTGMVAVQAGGFQSCATGAAGDVWCWGENENGELGVGDTAPHAGAVKLALPPIQQVSADGPLCALAESGQVYCWGWRTQVGLGSSSVGDVNQGDSFSTPQPIPGLTDVLEIGTGGGHACARRRNGEVLCWGDNESGQLGDGTTVQRLTPTPVKGLY